MTHIVVLGAGLGGVPMAYEMRAEARPGDRITVVSNSAHFQFVPSNPWVAVGRRKPEDIKVALKGPLSAKGIDFIDVGANRIHPAESRIQLNEGEDLHYDQLIIATGPALAWDEVPGLGPVTGYSQSICHVEHAARTAAAWETFLEKPGPVVIGAVQGASCFGPAYEFAFIVDAELRKSRLRDRVPMTFVTPEPYIGHLGLGGVGDSKGMLESAMR
jgi:sulfide:quinone oxidoreductase